jgi:hypothetical protein
MHRFPRNPVALLRQRMQHETDHVHVGGSVECVAAASLGLTVSHRGSNGFTPVEPFNMASDSGDTRRVPKRPREVKDNVDAAPLVGAVAKRADGGRDARSSKAASKAELPKRGGVYIPPFRLKRMMQDAVADKSSEQYQRMMWEALRKSLNGVVNKVCPCSAGDPEALELRMHPGSSVLQACDFNVVSVIRCTR